MRNSVFVKVRVEDELPVFPHGQYKGMFTTDRGLIYYCKYDGWYEDIEWWLKEIELPSEEEIYTLSSRCATTEKMNGFDEGANYILCKLK